MNRLCKTPLTSNTIPVEFLFEFWYVDSYSSQIRFYVDDLIFTSLLCIYLLGTFDSKVLNVVKFFLKEFPGILLKFCQKYLAHFKTWTFVRLLNFHFHYKFQNGVPKEVCLVDWQLMRYASPILDVVYYIFCCTTKEFREVHYQESLEIYYNSLQSYLKRYKWGIKI